MDIYVGESHVSAERLDELIRWHGTDETNLPHPDTLKNLSRDTVSALHELEDARETIRELRSTMGRAFCATDFRQLHAILLEGLGPPPPLHDDDEEEEEFQPENIFLASSAQNTAST